MTQNIKLEDIYKKDTVILVGKDYIPDGELHLRNLIFQIFQNPTDHLDVDYYMLAEAVFWSIGELINNANKANNRWAILENMLFQRITKENPDKDQEKIKEDIQEAIEFSQSDILKKYGLDNIDLTNTILNLIEKYKTNSFALSEKFNKKIVVTLKIQKKNEVEYFIVNVLNNCPITVIDKERVEYNLNKIKEDLINANKNPFEATLHLYQKEADTLGGGFGAGLRSIILFLRSGFEPFDVDIIYTKLLQYRSASKNTIFSLEIPIPRFKKKSL
ncbi:MAG: hypothetical protein NZ853_06825 [Leptospiraceae bacterium]|nr:hypothetical protein [Leptospiraceae bacterium]MDW7975853.1 hypothetical protein [Leptospiraceae bacterium]